MQRTPLRVRKIVAFLKVGSLDTRTDLLVAASLMPKPLDAAINSFLATEANLEYRHARSLGSLCVYDVSYDL